MIAPPREGAPTRVRLLILALISLGVTVNYLDRAIIGIASPAIASEFGLSPVAMGLIFSAFSWSYFAAQIPGGWRWTGSARGWSIWSPLPAGRSPP